MITRRFASLSLRFVDSIFICSCIFRLQRGLHCFLQNELICSPTVSVDPVPKHDVEVLTAEKEPIILKVLAEERQTVFLRIFPAWREAVFLKVLAGERETILKVLIAERVTVKVLATKRETLV
ncbi:hypothetical protein ACOMHN_032364 [Nucella lapillus]